MNVSDRFKNPRRMWKLYHWSLRTLAVGTIIFALTVVDANAVIRKSEMYPVLWILLLILVLEFWPSQEPKT